MKVSRSSQDRGFFAYHSVVCSYTEMVVRQPAGNVYEKNARCSTKDGSRAQAHRIPSDPSRHGARTRNLRINDAHRRSPRGADAGPNIPLPLDAGCSRTRESVNNVPRPV